MSESNYLVVEDFFARDDMEAVYTIMRSKNFQEGVIGDVTLSKVPEQKVRKEVYLSPAESKIFDCRFQERAKKALIRHFGLDVRYREPCKIAWYRGSEGGHYNVHRDTQGTGDRMTYRDLSVIVFLSDPSSYQGGELEIVDLDQSFKLPRGHAVFFRSHLLHGVRPVTEGERLVVVSFVFSSPTILVKYQPNVDLNAYIINSD